MLKKIWSVGITRTSLYNFEPSKPHFYIVKLGFTGVYIIFLISAQNIDCEYSLEPPRRGGSNEYPRVLTNTQGTLWNTSRYSKQKYEKKSEFLSELFYFLVVKFSVYLNRHVFVMGRRNFFFYFVLVFSRQEHGRACNCIKNTGILLRDRCFTFLFCIFIDKK